MARYMVLIGVLVMFVPSLSLASDEVEGVYRCQGPSDTDLYTNKKRPYCEMMRLPELTIAPGRGVLPQSNNAMPYGLNSFPSN